MNKNDVLKIMEEVVRIYFDYNCTLQEAIVRAKEVTNEQDK